MNVEKNFDENVELFPCEVAILESLKYAQEDLAVVNEKLAVSDNKLAVVNEKLAVAGNNLDKSNAEIEVLKAENLMLKKQLNAK